LDVHSVIVIKTVCYNFLKKVYGNEKKIEIQPQSVLSP